MADTNIDNIRSELDQLKEALALQKEISALKASSELQLNHLTDSTTAEFGRIHKVLDLQKEIAALRLETNLQFNQFKWAAWAAGTILVVVGFFGFKAWSDITALANTRLEKQMSEIADRYSNMARGFSLADSGRTKDAINYLTPLYDANHYDEPVLRTLLYSLSDIDDCNNAQARVKEIRQDNDRLLKIKDPVIFSNAAWILINCNSIKSGALEDMRTLLELGVKRVPADDPDRRFVLYNMYTYNFIKNDLKRAESFLEQASSIQADYPSDSNEEKNSRWFKELVQSRPAALSEYNAMWGRVKKRVAEKFLEKNKLSNRGKDT